jgi:hypothetical protein
MFADIQILVNRPNHRIKGGDSISQGLGEEIGILAAEDLGDFFTVSH